MTEYLMSSSHSQVERTGTLATYLSPTHCHQRCLLQSQVLSLFRCSNPRFCFLHQTPKNNPIHSSVSRLVIYAPMLGHPSQCQDNYTDGSSIHVWKPCYRSRYGGSWWEELEMRPAFGWRRHSLRCWRFSDDTHTMSTARQGAELQPHGWKHMKHGYYRI